MASGSLTGRGVRSGVSATDRWDQQADDLYEMANLFPRITGLPMTVWVSPARRTDQGVPDAGEDGHRTHGCGRYSAEPAIDRRKTGVGGP
jgi:hypothetical protein